MPSTRWLLFAVIALNSGPWIKLVIAAESNPLPIASNGWRPIIGTHDVKPYATIEQNQKQTISLTSKDPDNKNNVEKNKNLSSQNIKNSGGNQFHINHHGSNGHQSKLQPSHSSGNKQLIKGGKPAPRHPVIGKLHTHLALSAGNGGHRYKPAKPTRHQLRDEIMAPAPSSAIGSYVYFNQGPFGNQNSHLGNNKPYHSPSHLDFSNHFAFSNINNDVLSQQVNYHKHPSQNELQPNHFLFINQNDEFTRNLVPPPPIYKPQGEKETLLVKEPPKIDQSATVNTPQLVLGKHKDDRRRLPENFVVQLPPPYNQYNQQTFDLEITKEKFNEFHTTLAPSSYKTSTESYLDATKFTKQKDPYTKTSFSGYEVTENKNWAEHLPTYKYIYSTLSMNGAPGQQFKQKYPIPIQDSNRFHYSQRPTTPEEIEENHFSYSQSEEPSGVQFLPTPYISESAFPTSPTQAEVSTVYSEISQINKKKNPYRVPSSTHYNIKEVATHFPIFDDKKPDTQIILPTKDPQNYAGEVTTKQQILHDETESTLPHARPTVQTIYSSQGISTQRKPGNRRRRPTRPTTTTVASELITDNSFDAYQSDNIETEPPTFKPYRRRRPIKYRTTESPKEKPVTSFEATTRSTLSFRPKPTRGQPQTITEEVFVSKNHRHQPSYKLSNHHLNDEQEYTTRYDSKFEKPKEETKYIQEVLPEEHFYSPEETFDNYKQEENVDYVEKPMNEKIHNNHQYEEETVSENIEKPLNKRKRLRPISSTTETSPSTNLNVPENELDYTTIPSGEDHSEESITIKEVYDFENEKEYSTTLITSPATPKATTSATTTTETPTTKSNRIRQRPIKYDVQRPRFSVKDYRQRLSQYMSTSTTEATKHTSENSSPMRIRYPPRLKIPVANSDNEESTEPVRQKFVPKESRRKLYNTESSDLSTTEKYTRTPNPRLKSFGRYRSTTEVPSSTTQKVVIRSNIFNNLKRPQQLSLRNRIYNKQRNSTTTTTETYSEKPEISETMPNTVKTEVTIPFELAESKIEVTTQVFDYPKDETSTHSITIKPSATTKIEPTENDEEETFLQLQRISDLTSSAHKQYNTPGLFKSVSPTSRRVPSYFTLATEDPILPIEAFFPNLNQKNTNNNDQ